MFAISYCLKEENECRLIAVCRLGELEIWKIY